jgi:hypothetical protein
LPLAVLALENNMATYEEGPDRPGGQPDEQKAPPPKASLWDRTVRWATPLMVAASLLLGIKHEVQLPITHPAPVVSTYQAPSVADTRHLIARVQDKLDRLDRQGAGLDDAERKGLYFSILEDVKELLTIPCPPSAKTELLDSIVELQAIASAKVASAAPVQPIERRLQRALVVFLNACR